MLESVSILNSPSPSLQVINIVKDNQNEVPELIKVLLNQIASNDLSQPSLLAVPLNDDSKNE